MIRYSIDSAGLPFINPVGDYVRYEDAIDAENKAEKEGFELGYDSGYDRGHDRGVRDAEC